MEEIVIRIMKVVDAVGGNMSEFARKIDVTPAYISKMRKQPDKCRPSKLIIGRICSEFSIDEDWLITGNGGDDPVFVKPEKFSLDVFVKEHGGADGLELQIIKSYFELPKETRRMLMQHFQKGLAAVSEEETKPMRERAADLYDEQNQAEEKPDAPASSANGSAVG